jgi:hypothetical protein
VVPGCAALCWWQVTRALSGNTLSWAYVFEWPIFGGYAVFMWWKLIHDHRPEAQTIGDDPPTDALTSTDVLTGSPGDAPGTGPDSADEDDEELASYNRYLAALNASGKRKQW